MEPTPSPEAPRTPPWLSSRDQYTGPVQLLHDELFIRKAFEIDPAKGYELLFKRYYQPLCNHAARYVYSREQAEDIVSDVLCLFWQKELYQRVTTSYRAYLFTVVRHQALACLRAEFRRETLADQSQSTSEVDPEGCAVQNPYQLLHYHELSQRIEQAIESVSPQSQKVFLMSRYEGKRNAAIAEELQISVKTVEGHITKVLTRLRRLLSEDWFLCLLLVFNFFYQTQGK